MYTAPPVNTLVMILTGVGSFAAGVLGLAGTLRLAKSSEFVALVKHVDEIDKRADDLAAKVDAKETERLAALEARAEALVAKRKAEGREELLLNEITTLKWRQSALLNIVQRLAKRVNMSEEERDSLFEGLGMDEPPSITTFEVTDTYCVDASHTVATTTTTKTVDAE